MLKVLLWGNDFVAGGGADIIWFKCNDAWTIGWGWAKKGTELIQPKDEWEEN